MLNNVGVPGLIALSYLLLVAVIGVYSLVKIPNSDEKYNYAGFLRRLLAVTVDGVILALFSGVIAFFVSDYVGVFLGILIGWLYFAGMESESNQATLGKRLFGLRVVGMDGGPISLWRATGRHFGKLISLILFFGYFMAGWTKQKQGLHDKVAGCLVVRVAGPSEQS